MRAPFRLFRLENRLSPSVTPVGPLLRPYTFTEVLASIRADDPLAELAQWTSRSDELAFTIDVSSSLMILQNDGASLVQIQLQPNADPLQVVTTLRQQSDVEWAAPNYVALDDPRDFVPNDPSYSSQYHLSLMQTNKAWDTQTGSPAIIVAVTDDGLAWNHPDLAANVWINTKEVANNGKDDDGNGFIDDVRGWDFSSGDNNPNPVGDLTHGTHVAGIIAARTNNGVGVSGVAGGGPNGVGVRLMPIRWYGAAPWTAAIIAQSYAYAADNGAKIINSSYNFDNFVNAGVPDPVVQAAFDYAYGKGVLIFHSAGNEGTADPPRLVFNHVLHVANTDANDVRSNSSNFGSFVDIAAPGNAILSTTTRSDGTIFDYGSLSGTSMATPNAAGVAALIWSQHPTWTRDQVAAQLLGTTDSIDGQNPSFVGQLGTGRVNAFRSLTQLLPPPHLGTGSGLPAANQSITRLPKQFTLTVPMRLDPATVIPNNFDLRGDGPDNVFDSADDVIVPFSINNGGIYRIGDGELTFTTTTIGPADRYRFQASAALHDPFGQSLDGNGDGIGGDEFVRFFDVMRQVDGFVYEDRNVDGQRNPNEPPAFARAVYVDVNNNAQLDATTTGFPATDLPRSLLDNQTTSATMSLNGFVGTVTDLNVEISINHVFDSDLIGYLIGPTGAKIQLFQRVGGSDDNFATTVFDDQAPVSINDGAAPFIGSFRPNGPLADFNGLDPNGVWTLQISDVAASFTGSLVGWSLHVTTSEPMAYTDIDGLYGINGVVPGTYALREVMPPAWNANNPPNTGGYSVAINSNSAMHRDFGELHSDAIYGRFFDDANHSGIMEPGESPLPSWVAFLDSNYNQQLDSAQVNVASTQVPLAIPDNNFVTSTVSVNGEAGPISDVNVTLSISHFNDQQLDVYLIAPTGQKVELFTDVGGGGDHFTNTTLDDQAATSIAVGTAPFSGSFRPEGKLSDFIGSTGIGLWTLQVFDDTASVTGTLLNWSIQVTTAERSAASNSDGTFSIINVPAGSHQLGRILQAGFTPTLPSSSFYTVTMTAGQTITDWYFGQTQSPLPLPPTVESIQIDAGTNQRSLVRWVTVTFDQIVNLPTDPATSFQIANAAGVMPFSVDLSASTPSKTVARMLFSGSLSDGNYSLTVVANQIHSQSGQTLDGDANQIAGDDFTYSFHRLFGDADGNRLVSASDFNAFRLAYGEELSVFDFDQDGLTTASDFAQFRNRYGVVI